MMHGNSNKIRKLHYILLCYGVSHSPNSIFHVNDNKSTISIRGRQVSKSCVMM